MNCSVGNKMTDEWNHLYKTISINKQKELLEFEYHYFATTNEWI